MVSKDKNDIVFQLIKSLTKSEKRHFKLYFENNKNGKDAFFIILFDIIEKMDFYDEKAIMKRFPHISKPKHRNRKSYLYNKLLLSLRSYRSGINKVKQIKDMIENAAILFEKCLYNESKRVLKKAKILAEKSEQHLLLSEIFDFEKKLIAGLIETGMEDHTEKVIQKSSKQLTAIKNLINIQNISLKLYSSYIHKGAMNDANNAQSIETFFREKIENIDINELDNTQKYYYYTCLLQYHYSNLNPEQAYHYAVKNHRLYINNNELQYASSELFIRTYNQLLIAQYRLLKLSEFFDTYRSFKDLKYNYMILSTNHLQRLYLKYFISHECNYYFLKGDFSSGAKVIPHLSEEVSKNAKNITPHHRCIFYYKFACMHFGAGQFQKSVFWLNKIINSQVGHVSVDIKSFTRILILICHFELGNRDMVDYYIRSTYRYLVKWGHSYAFQRLIIDFLRNSKSITEPISAFVDLKKEMIKIQNISQEKRAFQYFDIVAWLESKIDNVPVQDVIKGKFEAILRMKNF